MATTTQPPPHVVVIPSPGMGHLIPLVEFAKLLHFHHHLSISLLLPSSSSPTAAQTTFLATLPPAITHTYLPPVDPSLLPPNVAHEVTIHTIHTHSIPAVRSALTHLPNVVAVVTDLFGTDYFDLAVPPYIYFTSNAFCLLFMLHFPAVHETVPYEYRNMPEPLALPGCVPLHGRDFVDPAQDRKQESYRVFLHHVKRYTLSKGIFVNTFSDLEPGAINALRSMGPNPNPNPIGIYPVGPVIQSGLGGFENEGVECMTWLDDQPTGSVLFVSFGSGGTLSYDQVMELAIGLEKSGQRFIWVVRSPSDSTFGSFFTHGGNGNDNPFGFLPDGYLGRVKGRGLLIPSWAPQIRVLAHGSTGGFLSHCGWNSALESIVNGVPLIAWPLYAEQRMNAVLLTEGLKVALRPTAGENGVVAAEEVARVVVELMEGGEGELARRRVKELSELARKARSEDGSSSRVLNQVVQEWSHKS